MRLSPAIRPDATGKMNSSDHFGYFFAAHQPGSPRPRAHTAVPAHRQADRAMIYLIVKTIIEHGKEFGELHPGGREFTIEKARFFVEKRLVPMPFHPGPSNTGGKREC